MAINKKGLAGIVFVIVLLIGISFAAVIIYQKFKPPTIIYPVSNEKPAEESGQEPAPLVPQPSENLELEPSNEIQGAEQQQTPPEIKLPSSENPDMLIFLSPQYAADAEIKQAISDYANAVENDVGWETKFIAITQSTNDFRKIDDVIEDYYATSAKKLKAVIMVGEDIDTALSADTETTENPATSPWATTGGESSRGYYTPGDENTFTIADGDQVVGHEQIINIAISLTYPTHALDYQTKSSQIASVFEKFSKNRRRSYPREIAVFTSAQLNEQTPETHGVYQTLSDYGNLNYKIEPTQSEIDESLTKAYMLYSVIGHSAPGLTALGTDSSFQGDDLDELDTPLFIAEGCSTQGWYAEENGNTDNSILDSSVETPGVSRGGTPWYGSRIFVNPHLRAMVLGISGSTATPGNYNFIMQAMPGLSDGKTLAESMIGHHYSAADYVIIYGDPTFHYN